MNSQNTLSVTNARSRIFDLVQKTAAGAKFFLTDRGQAKAVLMSADEFDSWQETMEVMREFPDLDKDIKETDQAIKSGEYKNWTTLEQLLAKEGFQVADKSLKKYGVSTKSKTKSRKRTKKIA